MFLVTNAAHNYIFGDNLLASEAAAVAGRVKRVLKEEPVIMTHETARKLGLKNGRGEAY
jgi:hypothetical protein